MIHSILTNKSIILILLLSISILTNAQISINTTGSTAHTSAMLDVSSTEKGMLVPRMTSVQRAAISTPADGLLVFDTTTDGFWYYNGTAAEWQKVGNSVAGASELNELSDTKYDGESLFIGSGTGQFDNGSNYNVAVGREALRSNISGYSNTSVGYYSMNNNETGNNNTSIGSTSMYSNTNGYNNVAFGRSAMYSNTSGFLNTAVGSTASENNTSGNKNTSIGSSSLYENTVGSYNTGIGNNANYYNQTGSSNTIIGYDAGKGTTLHNKSGNIFLGYQSGFNETGSNKLYIENSNSTTPLIGGDFANDSLFFNGVIRITGGNPGANKIFTSDADGNATWETNTAATEINDLSDGINDGLSLFLGENAGSNDDGANYNVGVGISSLQANTSGGYNTANGFYSLRFNTTGNYNIAYGYYTLVNNLSGTSNIAIGSNSLGYNLSGNSNIAIGSLAANQNTTGDYNVALGTRTNFYNQAGTSNTIIGYEAGKGNSNHSKSGNIFFGYQAGYNETGSNKLYIENSGSATPLIGGDFENDSLFFNGVIRITGGNPGANKILTSDADGNATWETSSSVSELNDLSDAIYDGGNLYLGTNAGINSNANLFNVGVGKLALEDNVGGFMNTSTGSNSLQKNTNGHNNTSYGYVALQSNLTANYNTAIGSTALQNSTGDENTALGYASLTANTSGTNNVSVGGNALKANINGHYNTAVGFDALQANQSALYNTALGAKSLYNTTGERNTASGFYSLYSNTTGAYNTAFGYRSGYENTTGTYNTFIGYNARVNNTTAKTNSTAVGNDAIITASNQVRIGNASVTSIGGYADWTNISDKRFKSNIKENVSGLDFILKLRPVTYNLDIDLINEFLGVENSVNSSAKTHKLQTGFIAQEVEIAAHELGYSFSGVDTPENDKDHYGLRYAQFVVPLVKAAQELAGRNDQLVEIVGGQQEMIEQLQQENNELKKIQLEIEELKKSIKMLQK